MAEVLDRITEEVELKEQAVAAPAPIEDPSFIELTMKKKFNLDNDQDLDQAARYLAESKSLVRAELVTGKHPETGQTTIIESKLYIDNVLVREKQGVGYSLHMAYPKLQERTEFYLEKGIPAPVSEAADFVGFKRGRIGQKEMDQAIDLYKAGYKVEEISKELRRSIVVIDSVLDSIR